jgi:hypothetical protein
MDSALVVAVEVLLFIILAVVAIFNDEEQLIAFSQL